MEKIISVIGETWWTHFENQIASCFLVANDWNLNIEWMDDNNIR